MIVNPGLYEYHLQQVLKSVEYLIMATPSGPIRDKLTEANIIMMQVQEDVTPILRNSK